MNVTINVNSVYKRFQLTQQERTQLKALAAKLCTEQTYALAITLATQTLRTTQHDFANALSINKISETEYEIRLTGKFPNMLENGAGSFDMKAGFRKSEKIRYTKGGSWYLIIPFVYRTPNANAASGEKGQLLPRDIYDLIRTNPSSVQQQGSHTISRLSSGDVPAKYDPVAKLVMLNNKAESFMPKSSQYAGLMRDLDSQTNKSSYTTFRRVGETSPKASWIHPGIPPYKILDRASIQANTTEMPKIMNLVLYNFFNDDFT